MFLYETAADQSLSVVGVRDPSTVLLVSDKRGEKPVRRILRQAFLELSGVRALSIAPGIEEIGDFACYGMPDLIKVSLCETLREVGDAVFRGCDALQSVHYAARRVIFMRCARCSPRRNRHSAVNSSLQMAGQSSTFPRFIMNLMRTQWRALFIRGSRAAAMPFGSV